MFEKYKELRDKKGVTDYQVSKETGLYASLFSEWKSGKCQPKLDKIKIISDYFGVPITYFIGD